MALLNWTWCCDFERMKSCFPQLTLKRSCQSELFSAVRTTLQFVTFVNVLIEPHVQCLTLKNNPAVETFASEWACAGFSSSYTVQTELDVRKTVGCHKKSVLVAGNVCAICSDSCSGCLFLTALKGSISASTIFMFARLHLICSLAHFA